MSVAQPLARDPARDDTARFLAAVSDLDAVLTSQRRMLVACGREPAASAAASQGARMLTGALQGGDDRRMDLLHLSIAEIAGRQQALEQAQADRRTIESIAFEAFVSAMHRIRTCMDVALGAAEEAAEIAENAEAASAAAEAARALRLVYHYTCELSDLAMLSETVAGREPVDADAADAFRKVMRDLAPVAADAHVALAVQDEGQAFPVSVRDGLLERALTYLVLTAIVTPGVRSVRCRIVRACDDGADVVQFHISDDGRAMSLEERARSSTYSAMMDGAGERHMSDSAGFAVARRLAAAVGGRIDMEFAQGLGTTTIFSAPMRV